MSETPTPKPGQVWRESPVHHNRIVTEVDGYGVEVWMPEFDKRVLVSHDKWLDWSRTATLVSEGGSEDG